MAEQHLSANEVISAVRDEPPVRRDPTLASYARTMWTEAEAARRALRRARSIMGALFCFGLSVGGVIGYWLAR